jgi:antitoxin component YwqK of YwqJK toxin-antitoxin module
MKLLCKKYPKLTFSYTNQLHILERKIRMGKDKRDEGEYRDGKKDGMWIEYLEFETRTGVYNAGKKQGEWETCYVHGPCLTESYRNGKKHGKAIQYDDKAKSIINSDMYYQEDKPNGRWTFYTEGKKFMSVDYRDGIIHGRHIKYWHNEQIMVDQQYVNGKLHGDPIRFDEWGKGITLNNGSWETQHPKDEGIYIDGKKDGLWLEYGENEISEIQYSMGKLNGRYSSVYPNGRQKLEANFRNDKRHGKWIWYNENGDIQQKGYFKNDERDGKWITFHGKRFENHISTEDSLNEGNDTLQVISGEEHYQDGIEIGKWTAFDKNGIKVEEVRYRDGHLKDSDIVTFHSNGLVKKKFIESDIGGKSISYYDNEQVKEVINYRVIKGNKRIDGERASYYRNGQLKEKKEYANDSPNGEYVMYFEGGEVMEEGRYRHMGWTSATFKDGIWTRYNKEGEVIFETHYGKNVMVYDKDGKLIKDELNEDRIIRLNQD